jgi:hypothetical protein
MPGLYPETGTSRSLPSIRGLLRNHIEQRHDEGNPPLVRLEPQRRKGHPDIELGKSRTNTNGEASYRRSLHLLRYTHPKPRRSNQQNRPLPMRDSLLHVRTILVSNLDEGCVGISSPSLSYELVCGRGRRLRLVVVLVYPSPTRVYLVAPLLGT